MLTYKIRVIEPDLTSFSKLWHWVVYAWFPNFEQLGAGTAKSKEDAVDKALTLLDQSEREEWQLITNDIDLHLNRR